MYFTNLRQVVTLGFYSKSPILCICREVFKFGVERCAASDASLQTLGVHASHRRQCDTGVLPASHRCQPPSSVLRSHGNHVHGVIHINQSGIS